MATAPTGALDRPPPGIGAPEFFETWLPSAFAAAGGQAPDDAPRVRATLSGPGGGQWDVQPVDDGLDVAAVPLPATRKAPVPNVWLRQTAVDFGTAFDHGPDLPELLPPGWSALDLLFLDPRDLAMLRQVDGRILVEVEGQRRRRWALDVAFGPGGASAGRPRATVRVDGATYTGVTTGQVPPLQALLQGRIRIEGDRALAMQVMMLLGQRLLR